MPMRSSVDNIHVTKLAAAKRQLMAATRMFFDQEDELAIHTIASAAYRLLSDLKSQRGRDELSDVWRKAFFYSIKAFNDGTLPGRLAENKEFAKLMREIANSVENLDSLEYDDFEVALPEGYARKWWRHWNRPSNFLKHADRDSDAHLRMSDVDNLWLLATAHSAYRDVAGGDAATEPEAYVLTVYFSLAHGFPLREEFRHVSELLEPLDDYERLKFCSAFIEEMKCG